MCLMLLVCLYGCQRKVPDIELSGPAQGTTYNVKIANPPARVDAHAARVAVDEVLEAVDLSMSTYRTDSEVSRFNASASTDWFEVSADLATVVAASHEVSKASGGALDITVGPLVNLWGFGPPGEPAQLPDQAAIDAARADVGYELLEVRLTPPALRKQSARLTIDLNAVAPGFTVDKLAAKFATLGIHHFMIDIGGEVQARGVNAQGEAWHIAVEKPVDTQPEAMAILRLPDLSVTTSGEYRHYYVRDGHRYSHTIDPRTARPVEHTLAAVVLIGKNSLDIDAWATALNVLGADGGLALATQRGLQAMFIVAEGATFRTRETPGFDQYIIRQ
jgi:thiamine biosynthesis lipoprotein